MAVGRPLSVAGAVGSARIIRQRSPQLTTIAIPKTINAPNLQRLAPLIEALKVTNLLRNQNFKVLTEQYYSAETM
ncbi:unnamed protein product [Acanthoscelides obtectus]|uniref:Uncharacterized protein n=1 Tax=Acanthoscelides obtectus TaxID=200917 RepID=A0A9P0K0H7_ACAOB|nr:unnamed protein product [Acanthoscelides obtectus]CAK1647202.1 hypothetical protein AOBTE_LOCUS15104 [Acanthoscelides obtectus]